MTISERGGLCGSVANCRHPSAIRTDRRKTPRIRVELFPLVCRPVKCVDIQELSDYFELLFDRETGELKDEIMAGLDITSVNDFIAVSACSLAPAARGGQLGQWFLTRGIELVGCGLVVCIPHPLPQEQAESLGCPPDWFTITDKVTGQQKLQKHWTRLGFRQIGTSDVFALHTDQAGTLCPVESLTKY